MLKAKDCLIFRYYKSNNFNFKMNNTMKIISDYKYYITKSDHSINK